MDEDIAIINTNTKNQKIKDFLVKFRKHLISIFIVIILLIFSYLFMEIFRKKIKLKLQISTVS